MDQSFALPVATHVARREAGRALSRGKRVLDGFGMLQDSIVDRSWVRFSKGRRLDGPTLVSLVDEIRTYLMDVTPLVCTETSRAATRVHPKGEAYEFASVHGFGAHDGKGDVRSLSSLRITLTRKRALIDQDFLGLTVTKHMLERSIERDLCTWTGGLREVDETLYRHQGLVVLWRWAIISRRLPETLDAHLPFGDGLILGRFRGYSAEGCCCRYVVDNNGGREVPVSPNDFHVAVSNKTGMATCFFEFVGDTTVHEDQMRIDQIDYRDAMRALESRHGRILARLREAASWRELGGKPALAFAEAQAEMDAAADDLASIALHPRLGSVLRTVDAWEGPPRVTVPVNND